MRLHRLVLQAFGPFPDRVEVDIDKLADQGLFLLHGQTGAGKTSLLDAVCFALYGAVPGDRAGSGRLRSDHAAPGVAPEVVCELSVGARRLEVIRSPAWERPKKKGTGTTTEQARTLVRELVDGEWVPRANRMDEAGLLLQSVLGMGMAQFTKVVLLPQGDFAAFLRSGADDRQRLLERLFGTETFSAVEEWLAGRRRHADQDLREARAALDRLVHRVDQASSALESLAGVLDAEPAGAQLDDDLLTLAARTDPDPSEWTALDLAEARLARAEDMHDRARAAEARARDRRAQSLQDADRETARHDRWTRYADTLAERRRLAAHGEAVTDTRSRVAAAREAAGLRGHLEQLESAEATRSHVLADVTTAAHAVAVLGLDEGGSPLSSSAGDAAASAVATPTLRDLRTAVSERHEQLGRLGELLELEAGHDERIAERDQVAAAVRSAEAAMVDAERAAGERAERRAALETRREVLAPVAASVPAATADLERAIGVATAARECARLQPVLQEAEATELDRRRRSLELRGEHLDLLQRRLDGMAGELAAQLRDHAPCPVCGAVEHPAPATGGVPVDVDKVDAARLRAEQATAAADEAATEVGNLRSLCAVATAGSGGLSLDEAVARAHRLGGVLESAQRAAADLAAVLDDLTHLGRQDQQAAERLAALVRDRAELRDRLSALSTRVHDVEQRLLVARGDDTSVAERRGRLAREVQALTALTAATTALKPAEQALRRARAAAEAAAGSCGFPDLAAARAALLDPDVLHRLEEEVNAHERALAAVAVRLDDPQVRLAADELEGQEPDLRASAARLGPVRDAAVSAEESLEAAAARLTTVSSAVRDLTVLAAGVRDEQKATEPLAHRYRLLDDLASCTLGTGGGNTKRMRLSAYVLAARLEQVAAAATARLGVMSDGRYALVHTDERARGGARAGLGLQVVDHWTNQRRETSSLSGGETFLASLSLALGLADVVQAESGGLSIETLFVDEGFGTLDEETLDQVMSTLDGLREGGRAVGVVSHVAELRQRIPAQLEVVKTPTGSSVRQVAV